MQEQTIKLLTIYTETALESLLIMALEKHGARGYTITNARGKGSTGTRSASWEANSNIRVEVICTEKVANKLMIHIQDKYYENYAMVAFTSDVNVLRPEKFI